MTNTHTLIRSLLIYSVCLPLAIYLGYLLATPDNLDTLGSVGLLLFILFIPLLLRYNHLLLIVLWNAAAVVPLLPGNIPLWLAMAFLSLTFSIFNRTLRKQMRFLPNLPVALPLLFLVAVTLITARLTGGIGFHLAGGDTYGGKRYLFLLGAIVGFFALVAQRTPPGQGNRYLAIFLVSEVSAVFSSLLVMAGGAWQYATVLFPANMNNPELADNASSFVQMGGIFRFIPLATTGQALFFLMLARYGVREILDLRAWWRLLLLLSFMALSLFGGFRSSLILMSSTFAVLFWVEGLCRTKYLPAVLCGLVLTAALVLPMAQKLPLPMQRTLSFLPIDIDPVARADAEFSSDWRIRIWKVVLAEVPHYLLLGKGFAINRQDLELAQLASDHPLDGSEVAVLAGDYHNGPLSVIVPLGIFGVIGFLWYLGASIWVLWKNHAYGDPDLQHANAFLLAAFIAKTVFFFVIYGSFYAEFYQFTGLIGLSICLNGGICYAAVAQPNLAFRKLRLLDATPGAVNR